MKFSDQQPSGCEHCPPGYQCNPISGACIKGRTTKTSNFFPYKFKKHIGMIFKNTVGVLLFCFTGNLFTNAMCSAPTPICVTQITCSAF